MKIRITKKGLPKAQYQNSQIGSPVRTVNLSGAVNPIWDMGAQQQLPAYPALADNTQYRINYAGDPVQQNTPIVPIMNYDNQFISQTQANSIGQGMMKGLKPFGSRKQLKGFVNDYNNSFGTNYKVPFLTPDRVKLANDISDWGNVGVLASNAVDYFSQNAKYNDAKKSFRDSMYDRNPSGEYEGNENINTGRHFENLLPKPNEGIYAFGGMTNDNNMKIRITARPGHMAYGGQSNYDLDLRRSNIYNNMPQGQEDTLRSSLPQVPRYAANIEAEGGETAYGDFDGDGALEHMNISGNRHTQGGVPLSVPEGSFIFSDTKKMRIKDPEILKYFGKSYKPGGFTPAQLAKQYQVNKYKAVIDDPNADELSKSTAQIMAKNYHDKLGKLSLIQESMKGFPQGIPDVASSAMPQAAYGGYFLPQAQAGAQAKKADPNDVIYTPEFQKVLADLKNSQNLDMVYSPRIVAGDNSLPLLQHRQSNGLFGDLTPAELDEFKKRHDWYFKNHPSWSQQKDTDVEDFQKKYDEEYSKKYGYHYFVDQGSNEDRKFNRRDKKFGEYTYNAPALQEKPTIPIKPTPKTAFVCLGLDNGGVPKISTVPQGTPGSFATREEAMQSCGQEIPNKTITTEKEKPTGYLTPDKLAILNAAANPPELLPPFYGELNYRPNQLALEDWLSQAQNIQQGYNTAANTLGTYTPGTATAANLSFLAGQAGDNTSQAISQVNNRNVDRFNQFQANETQRKERNDLYNTMARDKRFEGITTAKQNLTNARRPYGKDVTKSLQSAFNNRMFLDMVNKVNPIYNVDPVTGLSFFKRGFGPNKLGTPSGGSGFNGDWQSMAQGFNEARKHLPDLTISEYMKFVAPRTTYSDTDQDGIPNRVNYTGYGMGLPQQYGAMMNMGQNAYPYGG